MVEEVLYYAMYFNMFFSIWSTINYNRQKLYYDVFIISLK